MTEPDLFADWRPIGDLRTDRPADPQPEPAADKKIQRLQARAAEKRTNRHDAVQTWADKRRAIRDDRRAERAERRDLREQKRTDRTQRADRTKTRATSIARTALVTGPIIAPMAVAWTGQSHFATSVLGWAFAFSIVYAAAYELTTAYWAWLYHEARSDGDSGWEYRLATWLFATGAAVQQWWHYSNNWHATPRSVTYSAMSAIGVLLWEGYARLIHRRKLRAENKLAPARPRIGLARWVRYPVRSWTAWSLITLEGHRTLDAAWTAADAEQRSKKADRAVRVAIKEQAKLDRPVRSKRAVTGPVHAPKTLAVQSERTALPVHAGGPGRTATPGRRVDLTKADRTAAASGPTTTGRQSPGAATDGPDRRSTTAREVGPAVAVHDNAVDRTVLSPPLTDLELEAIDILRSSNRSISKRSIADVVRSELGRSIGSDRAADIARHFRRLRSAA